MPRIHVNVRPSTIQFDDGEDPIVSGVARFGTALSKLPAEMQQLRMQEAQQMEHKREFDLTNEMQQSHLKMQQDAQDADQEHQHNADIYSGLVRPGFSQPSPMQPSQDDQDAWHLYDQGQEERAARLGARTGKGGSNSSLHLQSTTDHRGNPTGYFNPADGSFHDLDGNPIHSPKPVPAAAPPVVQPAGMSFGDKVDAGRRLRAIENGEGQTLDQRQAQRGLPSMQSASPDGINPGEVEHHAQSLVKIGAAQASPAAANWITQMYKEHGAAFTDRVKSRVRELSAPAQPPPQAAAQPTSAPQDTGSLPQWPPITMAMSGR